MQESNSNENIIKAATTQKNFLKCPLLLQTIYNKLKGILKNYKLILKLWSPKIFLRQRLHQFYLKKIKCHTCCIPNIHPNTFWHIVKIMDYFTWLFILIGYLKILRQAKKWPNGLWYGPCNFHVSFNQEALKIWRCSFKLVKSPKTKILKRKWIQF